MPNTCCLYCSIVISFCVVWLNWRPDIFCIVVCNPVWVHQWVEETVYLWSKCGCVGIYRCEVYPLMKLISACVKVVPLQCVLTSSGNLSLGVHEVTVCQLWLCQCNPSHAWWFVSYDTVNLWGCPNGVDVKYNLLVVQAGVEWTPDVVEHCDVLVCSFYCIHH